MTNLYLPFKENGVRVWYKLSKLYPKSTLDSSNSRVYIGKLNHPVGFGDSTKRLSLDDYTLISYALSQRKIRLPRSYKKRVYSFNDNEIAASLIFDEVNDLIKFAEGIVDERQLTGERERKETPFSLEYLLELNKRALTLSPTLLLFSRIN